MKGVFLFLFTATLLIPFSPSLLAQQDNRQCRDSDHSLPNQSTEDRRIQGTTSGYNNSGRYITRRDVCNAPKAGVEYVCRDNRRIGARGFVCPGNEFCESGACRRPLVLGRCGMDQGWRNGATYVLRNNISLSGEDPFNTCFRFANGSNVTLNCNGWAIRRRRPRGGLEMSGTGILIESGRNITIQRCRMDGFAEAIRVTGGRQIKIKDNELERNGYGLSLSDVADAEMERNNVHDNDLAGVVVQPTGNDPNLRLTFRENQIVDNEGGGLSVVAPQAESHGYSLALADNTICNNGGRGSYFCTGEVVPERILNLLEQGFNRVDTVDRGPCEEGHFPVPLNVSPCEGD